MRLKEIALWPTTCHQHLLNALRLKVHFPLGGEVGNWKKYLTIRPTSLEVSSESAKMAYFSIFGLGTICQILDRNLVGDAIEHLLKWHFSCSCFGNFWIKVWVCLETTILSTKQYCWSKKEPNEGSYFVSCYITWGPNTEQSKAFSGHSLVGFRASCKIASP